MEPLPNRIHEFITGTGGRAPGGVAERGGILKNERRQLLNPIYGFNPRIRSGQRRPPPVAQASTCELFVYLFIFTPLLRQKKPVSSPFIS